MDKNVNIRKEEIKKQISLLETELLLIAQNEERGIIEKHKLKIGKYYKISNDSIFKVNEISNFYDSKGVLLMFDDKRKIFSIRNDHRIDIVRLTDEVSEKEFQEKLNNILNHIKYNS